MKRSSKWLAAALSLASIPGVHAQSPPDSYLEPVPSREAFEAMKPRSASPYLAFLPDGVEPDHAYWRAKLHHDELDRAAAQRAERLGAERGTVNLAESEPNDTPGTADLLSGFGTGAGQDGSALITGTMTGATIDGAATSEANGSLGTATPLALAAGQVLQIDSTIGDGAFGGSSGDFDFFSISLDAGDVVTALVGTPYLTLPPVGEPADLDPLVAVLDASGELVDFNEDVSASTNWNALLTFGAQTGGTYYVVVGGFSGLGAVADRLPSDPSDASSGPGAGSTGTYSLFLMRNLSDVFTVELREGDVLAAAVDIGFVHLSILGPDLEVRQGSRSGTSTLYPASSSFPAGVVSAVDLASESGTHYVRVTNYAAGALGAYELDLEVSRPATEQIEEPQILFLDFDGATIDAPALFGGGNDPATLSPLADFLDDFGLVPGDESAVIDAILAVVQENLNDLLTSSSNPTVSWELRNSRDHVDPFGDPNVSRVIVGGTTAELGLTTLGIAESIDTGNFATEETAVVLLDLLSGQVASGSALSQFSGPMIDLIGVGVGNIVTHEAGHFWGNFHTHQFNEVSAIQDQGGNLPGLVGVGPDDTIGTGDDVDVDFVRDVYEYSELFQGFESQQDRAAYALSRRAIFTDGFESGGVTRWQ